MEKFKIAYYVFNRSAQTPPHYVHDTFEAAKVEAERLAKANPNTIFQVLAIVAECRVKEPVEWRMAENFSELPF